MSVWPNDPGDNFWAYGDKENGIIRNPKTIYQTGIPQKLRELFNQYDKLNPNNPEDKKRIVDAGVEAFIPLFHEKFIVYFLQRFDDNHNCGAPSYRLGIFIVPQKMEMWGAVIYETKDGKYEICRMMDNQISKLRRKGVYDYWMDFKDYWI